MLSPRSASFVYAGLIFWLLYRDSRRSENSFGLWVPSFWIGIFTSKAIAYWLEGTRTGSEVELQDYLEGNPIDRNVMIVLMVLAIIILIKRRVDIASVFTRNKALWIFYLYLALSVMWSDFPLIALKRYIRDLGNILMIIVVLSEKKPAQAAYRVLLRSAYVLIPLSVLLIKYYPDIGRYYARWTWTTMYAGAAAGKNQLGLLVMVSGIVMVWTLMQGRKGMNGRRPGKKPLIDYAGDALVLAMCFWILNIADSSTSLGCFIAGVTALVLCRMKWVRSNAGMLTWGIYAGLVLAAVLMWNPSTRGVLAGSVGRDASLTTRTDIWAAVLQLKVNPVIGAGYNSIWLTEDGAALGRQLEVPHSHNGYLETYLNFGVVGLLLLLLVLLVAGRNAARQLSEGTETGSLMIALYFGCMFYNFTEVTFNTNSVVYVTLVMAAFRYAPTDFEAHIPLPMARRKQPVAGRPVARTFVAHSR